MSELSQEIHIQGQLNKAPFSCTQKGHILEGAAGEAAKYMCEEKGCTKAFTDARGLQWHQSAEHDEGATFMCTVLVI